MAIYRSIQLSFWTDPKITDDFSPEEKYFFLYLLTNPHTNMAGCYEIGYKPISDETGLPREKVKELLNSLSEKKVAVYSGETKEILIVNFWKYNWTNSDTFRKSLIELIENIKDTEFRQYLTAIFNGDDTVSIPYQEGINGVSKSPVLCSLFSNTVSDTDTVYLGSNNNLTANPPPPQEDEDIQVTNKSRRHRHKVNAEEKNLELFERMRGDFALSEEMVNKARDWILYKGERKEPYVERGMKSLLSQIEKRSQEAGDAAVCELITECMGRGWQGIIWEKLGDGKKKEGGNSNSNPYLDRIDNRINEVDEWLERSRARDRHDQRGIFDIGESIKSNIS